LLMDTIPILSPAPHTEAPWRVHHATQALKRSCWVQFEERPENIVNGIANDSNV
jgi:hypothetical protein